MLDKRVRSFIFTQYLNPKYWEWENDELFDDYTRIAS